MKVLVAEDHPRLRQSLVEGLQNAGYAVDSAETGPDAEHLAVGGEYDCILLDIMLPGRDGWAVLENLRKAGVASPVLCLTARDAVDDRVKGLDLGADDYLPKPFAWDELLARVRALVRRGHGQRRSVIAVDDLEVDTSARIARRGGKVLDLTAREYGLLEYLAMRNGQVVTRAEIWAHLYDQNDQSTSNVVDVYIGYLRNKIDRDHDRKLIHTRRGQGYLLAAPEMAPAGAGPGGTAAGEA
jgi:two-component system copper resistance phosphate regulon response regulator CusR